MTLRPRARISSWAARCWAAATQTLEIVTDVRHVEPNATSNQVVRAVLAGTATGSYLGKVAVARDAQKTDGEHSRCEAMLLTAPRRSMLKPELEIFADDVKCAHGATVGELDASALFYLQSRGASTRRAAKALMLRAFVADAFAAIGDERCARRSRRRRWRALERCCERAARNPPRDGREPATVGARRCDHLRGRLRRFAPPPRPGEELAPLDRSPTSRRSRRAGRISTPPPPRRSRRR